MKYIDNDSESEETAEEPDVEFSEDDLKSYQRLIVSDYKFMEQFNHKMTSNNFLQFKKS